MNQQSPATRRAFTLLELLTVVAIIALLIGILVPSLSAARNQAKKAKTSALIGSITKANEVFHNEFSKYPQSRGENPFTPSGSGEFLSGAQWLSLQLIGADLEGPIKPDISNDSNNDGLIDYRDWLDWYGINGPPSREYTRLQPFITPEPDVVVAPFLYAERNPQVGDAPPEIGGPFTPGTPPAPGSVGRVPFLLDAFNKPLLYYRANAFAEVPYSTNRVIGKYDQTDNAVFTGSSSFGQTPISTPGWDLNGDGQKASGYESSLGDLGWSIGQTTYPEPGTFAAYVSDRNIFETTQSAAGGKLSPFRPDSFILISAGADGEYGTSDDIKNFGQ